MSEIWKLQPININELGLIDIEENQLWTDWSEYGEYNFWFHDNILTEGLVI